MRNSEDAFEYDRVGDIIRSATLPGRIWNIEPADPIGVGHKDDGRMDALAGIVGVDGS